MSKTKRVEKTVRHLMESMHYAVKDLTVNGLHVAEAAKIVSDAALARTCILLVQAHGRPLFEANDLFANVKQLVYDYFTAAKPEKPVRPEIIPDPVDFPEQENGMKQENPETGSTIEGRKPDGKVIRGKSHKTPPFEIQTLESYEMVDSPTPEPKKARTSADILYPKRAR